MSPPVSRRTLGFSTMVTDLRFSARANSKAARTIREQPFFVMIRVDTAISSAGTSLNGFILGCVARASRTLLGQGVELHAGIHALGVLAEDDQVDVLLVIQGIPGIGLAGPEIRVEVELLAEADDGAEVGQSLALELGIELRGGVLLGLGGDGAEQAGVGLLEELDGPVGQGIAFAAPEIPADIAVDVLGVDGQLVEDEHGGFDDVLSDPVAGQDGYPVFGHLNPPRCELEVPLLCNN